MTCSAHSIFIEATWEVQNARLQSLELKRKRGAMSLVTVSDWDFHLCYWNTLPQLKKGTFKRQKPRAQIWTVLCALLVFSFPESSRCGMEFSFKPPLFREDAAVLTRRFEVIFVNRHNTNTNVHIVTKLFFFFLFQVKNK